LERHYCKIMESLILIGYYSLEVIFLMGCSSLMFDGINHHFLTLTSTFLSHLAIPSVSSPVLVDFVPLAHFGSSFSLQAGQSATQQTVGD
jgi:hypothetical protein